MKEKIKLNDCDLPFKLLILALVLLSSFNYLTWAIENRPKYELVEEIFITEQGYPITYSNVKNAFCEDGVTIEHYTLISGYETTFYPCLNLDSNNRCTGVNKRCYVQYKVKI